jgi:hypothetical protein
VFSYLDLNLYLELGLHKIEWNCGMDMYLISGQFGGVRAVVDDRDIDRIVVLLRERVKKNGGRSIGRRQERTADLMGRERGIEDDVPGGSPGVNDWLTNNNIRRKCRTRHVCRHSRDTAHSHVVLRQIMITHIVERQFVEGERSGLVAAENVHACQLLDCTTSEISRRRPIDFEEGTSTRYRYKFKSRNLQ